MPKYSWIPILGIILTLVFAGFAYRGIQHSGAVAQQDSRKVWIKQINVRATAQRTPKVTFTYDKRGGSGRRGATERGNFLTRFVYTDIAGKAKTVEIPSWEPFSPGKRIQAWLTAKNAVCVDSEIAVCPVYLPDSPEYAGANAGTWALHAVSVILLFGWGVSGTILMIMMDLKRNKRGEMAIAPV